jgi:rhamnose transport system ATP-binding protein
MWWRNMSAMSRHDGSNRMLMHLAGISKSFGGVKALKQVSIELRTGEVHALVGENGAGKSTLIKIITGAVQADEGSIELEGQQIDHNDPVAARRLGIAAIYQQPALFPDLTVAENIAIGLEQNGPFRRINWRQRRKRAADLLSRVGASIDPATVASDLTMPQQQLVEIARALGANAKVLILDEPTASLSEREAGKLFDVIRNLRTSGVGIIYISHRLDELYQIANRVTVLRDGTLVATRPIHDVDKSELIRLMVGRELTAVFPKQTVSIGEPVLELRSLGCRASGIQNIDLAIRAGEILGLAGLVGAGRTELARVLFGLTPTDSGQIIFHGKPLMIDSPQRAIELGIAYLPEDRRRHGVILELPISANTSLAILRQLAGPVRLNFQRERTLAREMVERLAIKTPSIDTPAGNLSGGNQQKVALSRWLATNPAVLILDEPTQGVDVGAKAEIHRLMGDLARGGLAILLISSELSEILGMSDSIAVMRGGTIVGQMNGAEATQERILALALGHKAA